MLKNDQPKTVVFKRACSLLNSLRMFGAIVCWFVIVAGGSLCGTMAYMLHYYHDVFEVFGRYAYFGASYATLFFGILSMLVAAFGLYDFTHSSRFTSILLSCLIIITSVGALVCVSIIFAFPTTMEEDILQVMKKLLVDDYGRTNTITNAWDHMQQLLRCCAISDGGWREFTNTTWFDDENQDLHNRGEYLEAFRHKVIKQIPIFTWFQSLVVLQQWTL